MPAAKTASAKRTRQPKKAAPKSQPAAKPAGMSDEHKQALAAGRQQGRTVRNYLQALQASKPTRGRRRSPESIQKRIDAIDAGLAGADALTRVRMVQERLDLAAKLRNTGPDIDVPALEEAFVEAALEYSNRKGISYSAWREVGVGAAVLKRAGIPRTRS